jgi:hypothetical protein
MNKGNNVMMISLHDGRTSRIGSSSSVLSNMLSMGEDLVDERRPHGVQGSRLLRMPIFLLIVGTMLKHGGGHATSQASKDGNNSSTLSLSLSF